MSKPMISAEAGQRATLRTAPTMPPAGPGEDRVLALEAVRVGEAAVRLHELQPHARQLGRDARRT